MIGIHERIKRWFPKANIRMLPDRNAYEISTVVTFASALQAEHSIYDGFDRDVLNMAQRVKRRRRVLRWCRNLRRVMPAPGSFRA